MFHLEFIKFKFKDLKEDYREMFFTWSCVTRVAALLQELVEEGHLGGGALTQH